MDIDVKEKLKNRKMSKRSKFALLILLGLIVIATGFLLAYLNHDDPKEQIPSFIKKQVNFQLYYPENLPEGLNVDENSFKMGEENEALFFTINRGGSPRYYVSIQEYPTDFDFTLFKKKFGQTDEFLVSVGNAFIGDLGSQIVGSIRTPENAWILVTSAEVTSTGETSAVARSFRKIN